MAEYVIQKQVDSSLSKKQVPISLTTNDTTIKSREQGLITKECVATYIKFKLALYFYG